MKNVLLVGTGVMAFEYYKALAQLGVVPTVVGNTKERADSFSAKTGNTPLIGGVAANAEILKSKKFDACLIAVTENAIQKCLQELQSVTCAVFVVEKPGAHSVGDLRKIEEEIVRKSASKYYIAYNRRYYRSVELIRKFAAEDGGIRSLFFDFTEVSDRVLSLNFPQERLQNWFFLNSTHVVDLAFDLIGWPKELKASNLGKKSWHGSGDIYSGFGVSEKGIPFSYHSDWNAPGRWAVEVMTEKRRFFLKPMEELHVQHRNQFKLEKIEFEKPIGIKDGIFEIVESVIKGDCRHLVSYADQVKHLVIFDAIRTGEHEVFL